MISTVGILSQFFSFFTANLKDTVKFINFQNHKKKISLTYTENLKNKNSQSIDSMGHSESILCDLRLYFYICKKQVFHDPAHIVGPP